MILFKAYKVMPIKSYIGQKSVVRDPELRYWSKRF